MELDPEEVSVVANAIGFAFFAEDGRAKTIRDDGVEQIDVDAKEKVLCKAAAERALTQLAEHRAKATRPMEDCWSGPMIKELVDAGVVPPWTQRVIIDIRGEHFAQMHILAPPTGEQSEKIIDVISAAVHPAEIITDAP